MDVDWKEALKHKAVNGWGFFFLVSIPMCVLMVVEMMRTDLSAGSGVSEMIGFSVRWAVPFIYLVVAASSIQFLFPGPFTLWWLRNRKYIGLIFAVAMAWQGLFIAIMSLFHRDYYFEEIFYLRDELEGSTGYIFLTAMVLTSFKFGRRHLTSAQWKLLHKSGIYFLWAYPFSVYWWNLYYYGNPVPLDYLYYWSGFLAFALRIAAWGKKRHRALGVSGSPVALGLLGGVLVISGLVAAATQWQKPVTEFLTGPQWSLTLSLWLPYWPFEPFLPLFLIGLGVLLGTSPGFGASESADLVRPAD
jgi:hypothetical protein